MDRLLTDLHLQRIYLVEIQTQCHFGIRAAHYLQWAMSELGRRDKGLDPGRHSVLNAEVFRSIHSLLTHAAMVSKMLWPNPLRTRDGVLRALARYLEKVFGYAPMRSERLDRVARGAKLRELLEVPVGDHPLRNRRLRNHLEHFDERLDLWTMTSERRNFAQDNIGPRGSIAGLDEDDVMRWFDPQARTFRFQGKSVNLQELVTALEQLHAKATARAEQLWNETRSSAA